MTRMEHRPPAGTGLSVPVHEDTAGMLFPAIATAVSALVLYTWTGGSSGEVFGATAAAQARTEPTQQATSSPDVRPEISPYSGRLSPKGRITSLAPCERTA